MSAATSHTIAARLGRWSRALDTRALVTSSVLVVAVAGLVVWHIAVGEFALAPAEVVSALVGRAEDRAELVVRELRLARAAVGALVGLAFGVSGALFQRVVGNPLATPDIVGVAQGASLGAVATILFLGDRPWIVATGALVGAVVAAVLVWGLAWRAGLAGYRLVLIGIGLSAAVSSGVAWLLTQPTVINGALFRASLWLTGSLNGRGFEHTVPVALALLLLAPVVSVARRHLDALELGDDLAVGLGVRVHLARGALIGAGVLLAAVATASAGPVAFVAFVAPAIARRLLPRSDQLLLPAGLTGACVVVAADIVARRVVAPVELPVGVVTAAVGGPVFLYLLATRQRALST